MSTRPKAVIVKGSPYYIDNNPKADAFYAELAELVRAQGYEPSFDAGEAYTTPDETAALWVGHSRGQSRLDFAPDHIKTLAIDQFEDRAEERRAENAKLMEAAGYKNWGEWPVEDRPAPPDEHYQVTDRLREALKAFAVSQEKVAMTPPPKPTPPAASHHRYLADDDEHEEYESVGLDGLLAASEKLLAINRNLAEPDERDSLPNDRIHTVDRLMAERIKLDHGRTLRNLVGRASRMKNLNALHTNAFAPYTVGYLTGNPLMPALEEINPMHILEQKRRVTKMGPGGIGDENAITLDMQCHSDDTEVFTRGGWLFWADVNADTEFACRVDGRMEFHKASELHATFYEGEMYGIADRRVDYLVTPNHRFWSASGSRTKTWTWQTAEEQFGKYRAHLAYAAPYGGSDVREQFIVDAPDIIECGHRVRELPPIDMGDWCEFLGWYCSEGSCAPDGTAKQRHYSVVITQTDANPECVAAIDALLKRMPFGNSFQQERNFMMNSKALHAYVSALGHRCWEKRIPEFIFEVKPQYRQRFLDAYAQGDGWQQESGSWVYTTTSPGMCVDLERLIIGMGRPSSCGTPWMCKRQNGESSRLAYRTNVLTSDIITVRPNEMRKVDYSGMVYCATVTGSLLLTRRGYGKKPIWTGNSVSSTQFGFVDPISGPESAKAGVDIRLATGTKLGSDGKVYQIMIDRKTGKKRWVSPNDLIGKTLKLPD